jgi:hypothetical protein
MYIDVFTNLESIVCRVYVDILDRGVDHLSLDNVVNLGRVAGKPNVCTVNANIKPVARTTDPDHIGRRPDGGH